MIVCIDIQPAIAQRAGVGRYTKSLVEHLGAGAGKDTVRLFYFDFKRHGTPFPVSGAEEVAVRWFPGRIVQAAWKTIGFPPFDCFSGPADVFHFTNFIRPPLMHGKSVVTIHDASFLRHSETTEPRNLKYLTSQIRRTVERADAILTISEFSGREIQELLKVPAAKIFPIHCGLPAEIRRPEPAAVVEGRARLGLTRPYVLLVGTIEPRKNISFLVNVFERMEQFDGELVIAGMRGWKYEPILERIRSSRRAASIRHLDFVDDALLPSLYAGAELFLFPSLYEGFGFPPLEAMACGTPVISSPVASLPEVLGDGAEYVPEFKAEAWAAKAQALLGDTARRAALAGKGRERAAKFTWEDAARKTWDVYRKVGA